MEKMTLTHWDVRGFTEPIKMLMRYLHVDCEETKLAHDDHVPSAELWGGLQDSFGLEFPSLPSFRDAEYGISLTHTIAICKYLAQKYRPKMVGAAMNECAEIDSILYLSHDMRNAVINAHVAGWEANKDKAMNFVKEKLGYMNKYMKSRTWLSGKQVSIADFFFCEVLEFMQHIDNTLIDTYPNCRKLMRKFFAIPEVAKYKAAQPDFDLAKYLKLPFQQEH